jgi:hypothetical protein
MRKGLKIGLGVVAAAVIVSGVGAASFGPVVRARVAAQARARGIEVKVGQVRPAFGRIWLRDVQVALQDVPSIALTVDHVEVVLGPTLGVREVAAHGGTIRLEGPPGNVAEQIRAWREKQRSGSDGGGTVDRTYSASGLNLVWREAFPQGRDQHAWGLTYERHQDGRERVGADLVRLTRREVALEVQHPFVELVRRDGARVLSRVGAETVTGTLDLAALKRPTQPPAKPASKSDGSAAPSKAPGPQLRSQLGQLGAAIESVLPEDAKLELSSLRLELRSGDQSLNVGPARLEMGREAQRVRLQLVPGARKQPTPLALRLDLPLKQGDVTIELDGGPISLAALGVAERSFGLLNVAETDITAKGKLRLRDAGQRITFEGRSTVERLNLERPRIAAAPMRGIDIGWGGKGTLSGDLQRIELEASEFRFGKTRFEVAGELEWERGKLMRGDVSGGVPLASCQSMIGSAPANLLPMLQGLTLSGTFSLKTSVAFDFATRSAPRVTWDMANDCRVQAVPPELDPSRFAKSWVREVIGADGRPVTVETGPGTAAWVPHDAISPHMPTAIVICEDARFYRHGGFDQAAIASAIADNLKAGKFVRGASTVSMQLAKNLYLARDKTASRKLQEAVLTILLEQTLSKDELMELYLNVIEFGPGIYGIGPAAAYYFNSTAGQLSLGQSLYLASILPNPRSHHFDASGEVTDKWLAYLHKLMRIAHKIHRISDEELEEGLQEVIAFQKPYLPPAAVIDPTVPADSAILEPLVPIEMP